MAAQVQGDVAGLLEAAMLVCFGAGWPVAIAKTLRVRRVDGKSLGFLVLVFSGYLAGIGAKFVRAANADETVHWVAALYAINAMLVAVDIGLCIRFRPRPQELDGD